MNIWTVFLAEILELMNISNTVVDVIEAGQKSSDNFKFQQ